MDKIAEWRNNLTKITELCGYLLKEGNKNNTTLEVELKERANLDKKLFSEINNTFQPPQMQQDSATKLSQKEDDLPILLSCADDHPLVSDIEQYLPPIYHKNHKNHKNDKRRMMKTTTSLLPCPHLAEKHLQFRLTNNEFYPFDDDNKRHSFQTTQVFIQTTAKLGKNSLVYVDQSALVDLHENFIFSMVDQLHTNTIFQDQKNTSKICADLLFPKWNDVYTPQHNIDAKVQKYLNSRPHIQNWEYKEVFRLFEKALQHQTIINVKQSAFFPALNLFERSDTPNCKVILQYDPSKNKAIVQIYTTKEISSGSILSLPLSIMPILLDSTPSNDFSIYEELAQQYTSSFQNELRTNLPLQKMLCGCAKEHLHRVKALKKDKTWDYSPFVGYIPSKLI